MASHPPSAEFIFTYFIQHRDFFKQFKTPQELAKGFKPENGAYTSLVDFAAKNNINLQNIPARDKDELNRRIQTWMARQIWRMEGYFRS